MRLGSFDPESKIRTSDQLKEDGSVKDRVVEASQARYDAARGDGERMVSCSDDFTLFLWRPETHTKPVGRLTGHVQLVNDVKFSPDARLIASASFDKSIKLWDGKTAK
jgi:ribosome assembly protein 4